MSDIFVNQVHGFNLQLPYNLNTGGARQYPDENGEWITITKRPNELPTVKLTTIVLYWRNDGNYLDKSSSDNEEPNEWNASQPDSSGNPNYRFYNNLYQGTLIQNQVITSGVGDPEYANQGTGDSLADFNNAHTFFNGTRIVNAFPSNLSTYGSPGSNGATLEIKYFVSGGNIQSIQIHSVSSGNWAVGDVFFFRGEKSGTDPLLYYKIKESDLNNLIYVTEGRQLGWIWGFPLFDVGRTSTNWPRFHSCLTSSGDVSGNESMLVDISPQRNIIVLDWKGQTVFPIGTNTGYEAIKYKQDQAGIYDSFYMTLRIKGSSENLIGQYNSANTDYGSGINGHWNLYNDNKKLNTRWATLVKYEYECDLIGPTSLLDFTLDRFIFNDSNRGRLIHQDGQVTRRLADPRNSNTLSITTECNTKYGISSFIVNIITGNSEESNSNNNNGRARLDRTNIYNYLGRSSSGSNTNARTKVQVLYKWNNAKGHTVVNLIGGWFNRGKGDVVTERNIGYYGDNFGTGGRQTNMVASASTETAGWKRFITLKSVSIDNCWTDNFTTDTYEFNNNLWCSLRSPRKIPVTRVDISGTFHQHRFITNFIDLSANTDNKIIGGGYGRFSNTIDMARESANPYYPITAENPNTVTIFTFDVNNDLNYNAYTSTQGITLNDLNFFKVSYKLLVPPIGNETYNITFNMGRKNQVGVTTFVRFTDMSGVCVPSGSSNLSAKRENESITLNWTNGDDTIQTIYFTDIASGFDKVTPVFDVSANFLTKTNNINNYDISFNVFQTHFFSRSNVIQSRDEIPYTIKTFDSTSNNRQFVDISYVPFNYQPYRYINYGKEIANGIENRFFDKNEYVSPMIIRHEKLKFNTAKWWNFSTHSNAKNIDPSGNENLPEIDIDISYNNDIPVFDNSYSIIRAFDMLDTTDIAESEKQQIVGIEKQTNEVTLVNNDDVVNIQDANSFFVKFFEPQSLKLGSNFIPDYWRLPDKINTLFTVGGGNPTDNYYYYNSWQRQIETNMILDILSITLKSEVNNSSEKRVINYLLVNSNKEKRDSDDWSAVVDSGSLVTTTNGNMIFEVQGSNGLQVSEYLNKKPIIVQLLAITSGPFGIGSKAFIGNTGGGSTSGNPPASADRGINVPYPAQPDIGIPNANNSSYNVNTFLPNVLRKGNGIGGGNLAATESAYNGQFDINLSSWNDNGSGIQNSSFNGTSINPSPLTVLIVDLSNVIQTNPSSFEMINDDNNAITINWTSFYFSTDPNWNKTELGDIFWTINRTNLSSGQSEMVLNDTALTLNSNNDYTFTDIKVRIYDKFKYTVSGRFKWTGIQNLQANSEIPFINVKGFTTPECFACKFNRFPFGRYNTTSTNLKLFRPLLINTPQGQVNQFGEKTCGGGCVAPNNPGLNLFSGTTRTSTNNNIYANTTNQLSKKQTYVVLSKSRFRPFR